MKKFALLTILFASFVSFANAGEAVYVCTEQQSVGFDWQAGQWVKTNFKGDAYSVRKVDRSKYKDLKNRQANQTMFCDSDKEAKSSQYLDGGVELKYACYSIVELGTKPWLFSYGMCLETYKQSSLESVTCGDHLNFAFSFDGQFIKGPRSLNVGNTDKKDSMVLSVGSCRPAN